MAGRCLLGDSRRLGVLLQVVERLVVEHGKVRGCRGDIGKIPGRYGGDIGRYRERLVLEHGEVRGDVGEI